MAYLIASVLVAVTSYLLHMTTAQLLWNELSENEREVLFELRLNPFLFVRRAPVRIQSVKPRLLFSLQKIGGLSENATELLKTTRVFALTSLVGWTVTVCSEFFIFFPIV